MPTCPNCRHHELPGAIFCSQCGALLEASTPRTTQKVTQSTGQLVSEPRPAPPVPADEMQSPLALYVMDSGDILQLKDRDEFTIGRSAEGQPIAPDIDLSPYKAYAMGVSRLHALIRLEEKKVVAMDLGSVNGTRLNGQKTPPHRPFEVKHGDILNLGKLKLQVLIRSL